MSEIKDHEQIWLEPKCAEENDPEGRMWSQHNSFEECCECGLEPVRYIRADIAQSSLHSLKRDMEAMETALDQCQKAIAMIIEPGDITGSTVMSAFVTATTADVKARAVLASYRNREGNGNDPL